MSYITKWKNKHNSKNQNIGRLTDSEKLFNIKFNDAPNYRNGFISHKGLELDKEEIDMRISNIDNV